MIKVYIGDERRSTGGGGGGGGGGIFCETVTNCGGEEVTEEVDG